MGSSASRPDVGRQEFLTKKELLVLKCFPVSITAVCANEERVACGSDEGGLAVFGRFGECYGRQFNAHSSAVISLLWSDGKDGKVLLVSGSNDKTIMVWADKLKSPLHIILAHSSSVKFLVTVDATTGVFLSGSNDRYLRLWCASTGAQQSEIERQEKDNLNSLILLPHNVVVTSSTSSFLLAYSIAKTWSPKCLACEHADSIQHLSLANEGQFASACADGSVILWSSEALLPISKLTCCPIGYPVVSRGGKGTSYVHCVCEIREKSLLAFGCRDGFVIVCARGGALMVDGRGTHQQRQITAMKSLAGGNLLATASTDAIIRFFDISLRSTASTRRTKAEKGVLLAELRGHSTSIVGLRALGDSVLLSFSTEGQLWMWKDSAQERKYRVNLVRLALQELNNGAEQRKDAPGGRSFPERDGTTRGSGGDGQQHFKFSEAIESPSSYQSGLHYDANQSPARTVQSARSDILSGRAARAPSSGDRLAALQASPDSPAGSLRVPGYLLDEARYLMSKKKFSLDQVLEQFRNHGHSDTMRTALARRLRE
mmetsp:Transcript_24635/g.62368  ORF Transcript_24635/g.62368 Transcript_24635/m.62368 type:complete len:544 (-) Transcript_24635:178-1809(-)|eukprot:CAMPEP_0113878898 /NCGR_PEP_ID=MMETSP0780_2-20120614/6938_1 /TAXON_ID=652834 /ORGANISM="Palpitomonas bilix" /LENGTH=543 /DNA_ID=CAMNT_0000865419 /DNA_START=79 /DNA_END=1710 /DNA_ORIENTATION=+ /assembly_acc=CAM_ASM_000599